MVSEPADELIATLRKLGAVKFNLLLPETKALASALKDGEKLRGIVYGRYRQDKDGLVSRGALVATDQRVILLNKKPLLFESDEITYRAISGADFSWVGLMGTVSLHTRMGDIHVRTFNKKCARIFVDEIKINVNRT
jgi:hypothetical protein